MAGIPEESMTSLGPWPLGVNNIAKETELPPGSLRSAINVDLTDAGWPRRRPGRTERIAATRAHSLFASDAALLANVDGAYKAYTVTPTGALTLAATVRSSIGDRYVSAAQVNEDVIWSNGIQIRRMDAELGDHPATLETPTPPTATASSTGSLLAGDYLVALTWRDIDGRESAPSAPVLVTLTAGQGILLTGLPAAPEDATALRVWCSPANGEVLYHARDLPTIATGTQIATHTPGRALETLWYVPMPAGDIVRWWNGRLFVVSDNHLAYSEALRPALMHPDNVMRFGERITMAEPVGEGGDGAGMYVSDHKRTYFMSGASPDQWQRVIRHHHSAVPGTSIVLPGEAFGLETTAPVAYWLASNGVFCLGLPGGIVIPQTEGRLATKTGAESGATAYRQRDGLSQLVTTLLGGESADACASDSAVATVRRNGVEID